MTPMTPENIVSTLGRRFKVNAAVSSSDGENFIVLGGNLDAVGAHELHRLVNVMTVDFYRQSGADSMVRRENSRKVRNISHRVMFSDGNIERKPDEEKANAIIINIQDAESLADMMETRFSEFLSRAKRVIYDPGAYKRTMNKPGAWDSGL